MHCRPFFIALMAVTSAACSQQDKKPRLPQGAVVGTWRSDTAASADSAIRTYELRTTAQGMAALVATRRGRDSIVARGTWDGADSLLRVVVRLDTGIPRPASILFAIRGAQLAVTSVSGALAGADGLASGLRFQRQ